MAREPRITQSNPRAEVDIVVEDHGSICLVRPITVTGQDWTDGNIDPEAQVFGGAVVVEPRYLADLVAGMQDYGLRIRGGF